MSPTEHIVKTDGTKLDLVQIYYTENGSQKWQLQLKYQPLVWYLWECFAPRQ